MARGRGQGEASAASMRHIDPAKDPISFRKWWQEISASERKNFIFPENLDYASFSGLDLSGQNLSGRSMYHADMHGANLNGTNFRGADVRGASFGGASTDEHTDFTDAQFDWQNEREKFLAFEDKPVIVNREDGSELVRYWVDENDDLHRDNELPAVIWPNGTKEWHVHGERIRTEES